MTGSEDTVATADYLDHPYSCAYKADELSKRGEATEALHILDLGLKRHTARLPLFLTKGHVLCRLGKKVDALDCYDQALECKPDDPVVLYYKALVLHDLERDSEAIEPLNRSLMLRPGHTTALRLRDDVRASLLGPKHVLDDVLNKLVYFHDNISFLRDIARSHPEDERLLDIFYHYGIMELYNFICALGKFDQFTDGDEKSKFCAVKPLVYWLLTYKDGLRHFRNERVAHIDNLKTPSMEYQRRYILPSTVEDFDRVLRVISFLRDHILNIYSYRVRANIKRLEEQVEEQQKKGDIVDRNADLSKFKKQVAENLSRISDLFSDDEYRSCIDDLDRL